MIILPAIDILEQKPVRLYKGDYNQKEVVGHSVLELAKAFELEGAAYVHLVDLDGAKSGDLTNKKIIIEVANSIAIPVEVGGGIRSMEAVSYYLDRGVDRVILGTSAIEDITFLKEAIATYGKKVAVGIDCKDGFVYGRGWLEASQLQYIDFAKEMESLGVQTVIVTDISKDGTLEGVNVDMLARLQQQVDMNIIASGGIKDIEDIKKLKQLNIYGAITGKAMYHHTLDLKEAIKISEE